MNKFKAAALALAFSAMPALKMMACDVCRKNQPEVLRNITHGTGPESNWDYIIIWPAVAIVFFLSLKFLIRPNEAEPGHIKNIVVE